MVSVPCGARKALAHLAYSWQEARGFPLEVDAVLRAQPAFSDIELLLAVPEHQVPLVGGSRPSQNDIWALGRAHGQLVSVAVEGKVAEPFGPTIDEWKTESKGKTARLAFLCKELDLPAEIHGAIRYQLLHRTVSAILEARRFNAAHAVMLVHSFSQAHQWFEDYAAFAALLGRTVLVNEVVNVGPRGGVDLHLAWVCGDSHYLTK
jgi:hypothetical protein